MQLTIQGLGVSKFSDSNERRRVQTCLLAQEPNSFENASLNKRTHAHIHL